MDPPRTSVMYARLQVIPVVALCFVAWFVWEDHRSIAAGTGDDGLIGFALLLIPVTYAVLPAAFIFDLFAVWKTLQIRDFKQSLIIFGGMACVVVAYVLILRPS